MPGFLRPDRLRQMIEAGDDTTFLVVDVRPGAQYRLDHIPGAVNIPLDQIESWTGYPGHGGNVVFYCRNGIRSKVAAILVIDGGLDPERVLTLEGGIAAYTGEILLEPPRLMLLEGLLDPEAVAAAALNFEKGAWRFYTAASKRAQTSRIARFLETMARLEVDHARALFRRLDPKVREDHCFASYFNACSGDIMEGGKPVDQILLPPLDEDILELALEIETGAYDLYKQGSLHSESPDAASFFLGLAGDEKKHMAMIAAFLSGHVAGEKKLRKQLDF